jgi:PAS domain S-box-containing protein
MSSSDPKSGTGDPPALERVDEKLERPVRELEQEIHDLRVRHHEVEMRLREASEARRILDQRLGVLIQARSRYERLYDYAPVAACTLDREGRILQCNLTLSSFIGSHRGQLIGRSLTPMIVPEDASTFARHLRTCIDEKRRVTCEVRLSLFHFGTVPFQVVSTPLGQDGETVGACNTAFIDMSTLKRSEERLGLLAGTSGLVSTSQDLGERLAELVRGLVPTMADLCIVEVELDGVPRRFVASARSQRPNAVAALRAALPERLDAPTSLLVIDGGLHELAAAAGGTEPVRTAVKQLGVRSLAVVPVSAGGTAVGTIALAMTAADRRFTPSDLIFAQDLAARIGVALDNKRLYADAQRAVKARQDLLSIVSHDLRSPMSGVLLSADALLQTAPPHERRAGRKHVLRIRRSVMQMRRLVEDLLDMASLEKGALSIEARDFSVLGLLDETAEMLKPLAEDQGVTLTVSAAPDLRVHCDRERVLQVLWNLVGNALRYTPPGGHVQLRAAQTDDTVCLQVQDSGPGIPPPIFTHLFEREAPERDTRRRGRGLGLFICKGIIQAHGGKIWVESRPGEGAVFSFTLAKAQSDGSAQHRTVLIVEDDLAIREVIAEILKNHGWQVVQASNGRQALAYLEGGGPVPSVMLLDLSMPEMDGRQLMHVLKERSDLRRIPVFLLSSAERLDEEVAQLGAVGALKKPPDMNALLDAISSPVTAVQA